MSLFNVDFDQLAQDNTPVQLRRGLRPFIKAFIAAIKALFAQFTANRDANLYRLRHSSQVVYMEAVLNDAFDFVQRRIVIADPADIDSTYIFKRAEIKPKYAYTRAEAQPLYIYLTAETYENGPDFLVLVPAGIVFDTARMKALINDYRLASKSNYQIITV